MTTYGAARCTVFVALDSLSARPVADSIGWGTPVITSDFASMRELGEPGGALLVNPRDDHQIAEALRSLVTDDALRQGLARQARERVTGTFGDYADRAFAYLVEGTDSQPL